MCVSELHRRLSTKASLHLHTAAACYPHADKMEAGARSRVGARFGHGGEDAYFVVSERRARLHVVGVADGVGGWQSTCHRDSKPLSVAEPPPARTRAASHQG